MNYLLPLFLTAFFLFSDPVIPEKKTTEPIVVYPVCRVLEGHFGSFLGSATYLCRRKTDFYFLSVDHVVKYSHPYHPILIEVGGGNKAVLYYVWRSGELSLLVCSFPETAISMETNIAVADPVPGSGVFIDGFAGGFHRRCPGIVDRYDICNIIDGRSSIVERSVYVNVEETNNYGGVSGGAIFQGKFLAAIFWAQWCNKNGKDVECYKVMGIPASEIRKRLETIKGFLPPDFVSRTFPEIDDKSPRAK